MHEEEENGTCCSRKWFGDNIQNMHFAYVPCSEFLLSSKSSCVIRQMVSVVL